MVVFQSSVFRQILANFGNSRQFGANFVALVVADSMPKVWMKSLKLHNFWTMSPNIMCSISLKSYNPYLHPQKVSKNSKTYCIHSNLPKNEKSHFGSLSPLEVNLHDTNLVIWLQQDKFLQQDKDREGEGICTDYLSYLILDIMYGTQSLVIHQLFWSTIMTM